MPRCSAKYRRRISAQSSTLIMSFLPGRRCSQGPWSSTLSGGPPGRGVNFGAVIRGGGPLESAGSVFSRCRQQKPQRVDISGDSAVDVTGAQ